MLSEGIVHPNTDFPKKEHPLGREASKTATTSIVEPPSFMHMPGVGLMVRVVGFGS